MNVNGVSANRLIQKTAEEKNSSQHRVLKFFEKHNNLCTLCHSVRFNIVIQYPLVVLWKGVGQFVCAVCNNPVRERLNPEVIHLLSNELKADQCVGKSTDERFHPIPSPNSSFECCIQFVRWW
mmetsp:Transcript_10177/g.24720  ORF Transcript_10177/g.24720 Transcript_10177/m.24720 type:complete len:123 (+) Transcript_10177:1957-2325(+)